MPKKYTHEEKQEHTHRWTDGLNPEIWYCGFPGCRAVKISQAEYNRRVEEYKNYYDLVRHSISVNQYLYMRVNWRRRNNPKVQQIAREAALRVKQNNYMERPPFNDPRDTKYEVQE